MKLQNHLRLRTSEQMFVEKGNPVQCIDWSTDDAAVDSSLSHKHDYDEILFFLHGSGKIFIDGKSYLIADRSVHFIRRSQLHAVQPVHTISGGHLIFHCKDLIYERYIPFKDFFLSEDTFQPNLMLSPEDFEEVWALFLQMKSLSTCSRKAYVREYILTYFNLLLLKLADAMFSGQRQHTVPDGHVLAHRFRQLVEKHFINERSVEEYARQLHICPKYLNEVCKKAYDLSPSQMINQRLTKHIQGVLSNTDLPLKEIAYQLKFNDQAYFSRFFKKMTNLSPREFRKRIKSTI